ncbi:MAG: hypothetical protein RLZZ253_1454 [Verrucomicrobiota bacterium]|jgi:hypothetical protein
MGRPGFQENRSMPLQENPFSSMYGSGVCGRVGCTK